MAIVINGHIQHIQRTPGFYTHLFMHLAIPLLSAVSKCHVCVFHYDTYDVIGFLFISKCGLVSFLQFGHVYK